MFLPALSVFALCLVSAGTDLRARRVPNIWLALHAVFALLLRVGRGEVQPIPAALTAAVIPFLLLFPLFLIRAVGAGDIKLLMVIGLYIGRPAVLHCLLWSFLFAGVFALPVLFFPARRRARFSYLFSYFRSYLKSGRRRPYIPDPASPDTVHMTIPVLMSVLLWIGGFY